MIAQAVPKLPAPNTRIFLGRIKVPELRGLCTGGNTTSSGLIVGVDIWGGNSVQGLMSDLFFLMAFFFLLKSERFSYYRDNKRVKAMDTRSKLYCDTGVHVTSEETREVRF